MFAVHDQENLTHAHQTAAAAKPLNRGLGAKTPARLAPKTPFKVPLNDENVQFRGGKSVLKTNGKGNENLLPVGKKGGDVDKSAFVTPAGPRSRAPLGMKTTNAKTKAFQTPAPASADNNLEKTQPKTQSPRMRRAKVKIHFEDAVSGDAEDEEREIEYMPPRGEPLPDHDDTMEMISSFPMFEGANLTRGIYETYYDPVDDGGVPLSIREANKLSAKFEKELEDRYLEQIEEDHIATLESLGFSDAAEKERAKRNKTARPVTSSKAAVRSVKTANKPAPARLPGTITARSAATALSKPLPTSAAANNGTASMRARAPVKSTTAPVKSRQTVTTKQPSTMHPAAATVISRSTLGYGKGRAASGLLRKNPMTLHELNASRKVAKDSNAELEAQLAFGGLSLDDSFDDDLFGNPATGHTFTEESEDEFQLQIPAGF